MIGIRFSSTQVRTVSRMARSSSDRRESRLRKSTPVNWEVPVAVAISASKSEVGCWQEYKQADEGRRTGGQADATEGYLVTLASSNRCCSGFPARPAVPSLG